MSKVLTVTEISNILHLKETTILRWAREGKLPSTKLGRYWFFLEDDFFRWIKENQSRPLPKLTHPLENVICRSQNGETSTILDFVSREKEYRKVLGLPTDKRQ